MSGEAGLFRYGFERSEGFPGHQSIYLPFSSETLEMDRPYEPDPNLDPSGSETAGDNLKAEGKGKVTCAPNSESSLQMRICQHGFYEHSTPEAGREVFELRHFDELTDDELAHYVESLWFGIWRDQEDTPSEYNGLGAKIALMTMSVDANKFVKQEHDLLYLRDRYMAEPSEVAVNAAWTGEMSTRGHRISGDENGDYFKFKATLGGALGVAKFVWGKGVAAYGATEYLTAAVMDVMNADDTLAGTKREPIQLLISPNVGDVFTIGDEWHIDPTSGKPVPVYSERPKLTATEMDLSFTVGGVTKSRVIDQFSIKHGTPREAKFTLGSKYAGRIGKPANSKQWWEISFSKTYLDREFDQALIAGTTVAAFAKFYGALIGSTGEYDFHQFDLPNMKLSKAGATITTPGELKEQVTLRAFSVGGSQLCTETLQNTIASVDPADFT